MNWTKEKPTKDGFYWHRGSVEDEKPIVVSIFNGNIQWPDGSESNILKDKSLEGCEWYGPLKPPEDEIATPEELWKAFWGKDTPNE